MTTTQRGDARRTAKSGEARLDVVALYAALNRERLRRARDYRNSGSATPTYSWSRVSREVGVSNTILSKLEGGSAAPSADTLVRLLVWLGTTDMAPFITHGSVTA